MVSSALSLRVRENERAREREKRERESKLLLQCAVLAHFFIFVMNEEAIFVLNEEAIFVLKVNRPSCERHSNE